MNNYYKYHKINTIHNWKNTGLIGDYDLIYDRYMNTSHCDKCGVSFELKKKCMDHCHTTGEFRNILCNMCNSNMIDKSINKNNKSGFKCISWNKYHNSWKFSKHINGTIYQKQNKNIDVLHWIKFVLLLTKSNHAI